MLHMPQFLEREQPGNFPLFKGCLSLAFSAPNLPNFYNPKPTLFTDDHAVLDVCFFLTCHWAVVPTSDRWPKALIALQDRVFLQLSPGDERRFFIYDIIIYYWIIVPSWPLKNAQSHKLSHALPNFLRFETSTTFTWKIAISSIRIGEIRMTLSSRASCLSRNTQIDGWLFPGFLGWDTRFPSISI